MRIERFDPEADPPRTRACYKVHLAGAPVDDPRYPPMSLRSFTGWLACGWTEDQPEVWSASPSPDRVDGCYTVAMPRRENRHLAYVHPEVTPARRRAGLGTTLLRHAAARTGEDGRTTLAVDARDGSAGEAFARALGAPAAPPPSCPGPPPCRPPGPPLCGVPAPGQAKHRGALGCCAGKDPPWG